MKKQWIVFFAGLTLLAALLTAPDIALAAAREGSQMFIEVLVPSLLPYLIAGGLITQPGFLLWCGKAMQRIMPRIFRLPGAASPALCLSLASGYPAGARMTGSLMQLGILSPQTALRTAQLASHAGPAFIVGSLGTAMLGSSQLGFFLWICHCTSSIILEIVSGFFIQTKSALQTESSFMTKSSDFSDILLSCARTLAIVGSTVIFFSVLLGLFDHFGILRAVCSLLAPVLVPLGIPESLIPALFSGMIEMTSGCRLAVQSSASLTQLLPVLSFLLGFGGLSVHVQSLALLPGIPAGSLIGHKIIQALTSMLLTRAALFICPAAQPAFLPSPIDYAPIGFGQLLGLSGIMLAVMLTFYLSMLLIAHVCSD